MIDEIISDEVIVEGLRCGDQEAHTQLWQKYGDSLIRFLQSKGADAEDAADAAVDSVARAVEKIDQFDPVKGKGQAPFRNWLFTIARNIWHDQQRKQMNMVSWEWEDEFTGIRPQISVGGPPTEIVEALNHALSVLPDNQRQTITMYFYDNMPLNQIAQMMGVPEGTVRQWKKRALATLKTSLKDMPIFANLADPE